MKLTTFSRLLPYLLTLTAPVLFAQPGRPVAPGSQSWQLTTSAIWRADTDLDSGGEVGSSDLGFQLGTTWGLTGGRSLGTNLKYQLIDYDFSAAGGWGDIQRLDLGLSYSHPLSRTASLFAAPSVGWSAESGGFDSDALTYGGVFGYSRQVKEGLSLGFGAGLFLGLEDTSVFPVLFVRWQINEHWRLGNPFRPGPTGPAGIELAYQGIENWEFAIGGGYRSERFALESARADAARYGEERGVATFVRASRTLSPGSQLDLYLGTLLAGQLSWDDARGHRLWRTDSDPSLLAAVAFSAAF